MVIKIKNLKTTLVPWTLLKKTCVALCIMHGVADITFAVSHYFRNSAKKLSISEDKNFFPIFWTSGMYHACQQTSHFRVLLFLLE